MARGSSAAEKAADEAGERARYRGGPERLAETLFPHATAPGWFQYAREDGKGTFQPKVFFSCSPFFLAS